MTRNPAGLVLAALLASCVHGPARQGGAPAAPDGRIFPAADHHKHLISEAAAKFGNTPPLATVQLPDDLARLLQQRAAAARDTIELAKLYVDRSVAFSSPWPGWFEGRPRVAFHVYRRFARPYALTPTTFGVEGSSAFVGGYYTEGGGEDAEHVGRFLLSLARDPQGSWRIMTETPVLPGPERLRPVTAERLIASLDSAGIRRAVVLSVAYWFGSPLNPPVPDEYTKVRAENDWVAQEVARHPDRLVGFCSFNPLKDYAIQELERCVRNPHLKGLKLHFGNSGVDVLRPEHVERVRAVFSAANRSRYPIVAHLWTLDRAYGRPHTEIFLNQILPAAPDVPVQIAHMAGGGRSTDAAMAVFADAIAARDPRTRNVYFDVATVTGGQSDEGLQKDVARMRQIGMDRFLWGSDGGPTLKQWREFQVLVPLSPAELRTIAANVAPYLR